MLAAETVFTVSSRKAFERAAEDLESATVRHGLKVVAIHALDETEGDYRIYEVCLAEGAEEILKRVPDAAVLVPCRIVIRREGESSQLSALRPGALLTGVAGLEEVARKMEQAVSRALTEAAR